MLNRQSRSSRLQRTLAALLVFLALLAFLQWGVPLLEVPAYILPRPSSIVARLLDPESNLLKHFAITTLEGVGGFVLGSLFGFLLAVVFVHVPPLEDALYPWAVISQTIPLVALAPLLVIWFGNGMLPRMAMSALFTFFPVLVNTTQGLRLAERETLDLLHSYAINRWQLFWILRLPKSLPYLFSGLKIGSTLAIIGAIVGEFAGAAQGLGFVITVSTYHLETDQTFAAIVAASLPGIALYLLLVQLERRVVFWQERA
jgi:ABC-type nitrate/sulfonate/bicarbonate transport system permease component